MNLEDLYANASKRASDINEHMETLVKYGSECKHITEMGVRAISTTYAFMKAEPKEIISYDLESPDYYGGSLEEGMEVAQSVGIDWKFIQKDVLKVNIEPTELLFIDTFHAYDQLTQELSLHSDKVSKYIILHDTTSFENFDEPITSLNSLGKPTTGFGLWRAVEEFLEGNSNWELVERFTHNNGLTILGRVKDGAKKVIKIDEDDFIDESPLVITPAEIDVEITEEVLDMNPELVGEVEIGDVVQVTEETDVEEETEKSDEGTKKHKPASRSKK